MSFDNVNDDVKVDTKGAKHKTRILTVIKENPNITIAILAQSMGVSQSTVSRVLKKLKDEKIIQREGADKRGKWIVL